MPVISIGLPAFNSERTLRQAIRSIIGQTYTDWELLVMDDGSSDGTAKLARSFDDPRIKVMSDGGHRGLPGQLNRAVDLARGRYFARMDADDIAYPSRLEKQTQFLDENSDIHLLGTWMTVFKSDGSLIGTRRFPTSHSDICARPWAGFPMAHPTWIGRIEWFRLNRYNEAAMRMEDRELLLRSYRTSRFAVLPEVLLAYREDSLSLRKILFARKNTCKMALRYAAKEKKFVEPGLLVLGQCARAVVETVALPTGLTYKLLRSRAQKPTPEQMSDWRILWAALGQQEKLRVVGCGA